MRSRLCVPVGTLRQEKVVRKRNFHSNRQRKLGKRVTTPCSGVTEQRLLGCSRCRRAPVQSGSDIHVDLLQRQGYQTNNPFREQSHNPPQPGSWWIGKILRIPIGQSLSVVFFLLQFEEARAKFNVKQPGKVFHCQQCLDFLGGRSQ